ncbi:DNA polymerase III subunit beta [Helicobacter sp. 12S02634-8]|uniref:DNA polymerase III subunit beta n=1 Tax=Helicobacter sp. 12S02634-8 TaxID=1476199 RepID=UPI000BA7E4F8|nr:DNA polymerase III subunit beta [Helicobacter sp. 12S02634-8]PAF47776.1 DNA polymerase III subunit beta [Helicobacter sp. 12S02634-8]
MKIIIGKSTLEMHLRYLQNFLDKRDSSQITSHLYFEVIDNHLTMKATDYEMGLETKINIPKKESDGNATVNGKKILDIISRLKDGEVLLETDNEFFHIKQGKSKFKLPMFDASQFPTFPETNDNIKINIEASKFFSSIKKVSPAIDTGPGQKTELKGALLEIKNYGMNFVATDTKRLSIVKFNTQTIENLSFILPKRSIVEILKIFFDETEIYYDKTQLILKTPQYRFFTKLINGIYPDYEKIIKDNFKNEIKLPKDKIIDSLKLISSLANNIKLIIKPNEIIFESISNEKSESASTQMEVDTHIDTEITLGANSKHILDFLTHIDSTEFSLCINEVNMPFSLKDGNFSSIIMPVIF